MLRASELLLDWRNPRLKLDEQIPDEDQPDSDANQRRLALVLNKHYNPLRVAESIAKHQYFHSEPLIAVPHGVKFRVIEGNRRLTAIRALQDAELRGEFAEENRAWAKLSSIDPEEAFPVLVVTDESAIAPLLGYRHVAGIEPWAAFAQARYITSLVDNGSSFSDVAELVGKSESSVRSMYRDFDVLVQADEEFELDVSEARKKFGVFSNAMGRQGVREFIQAPAPRHVRSSHWQVPESHRQNLAELLIWIFGGANGGGRVIADSRQLGILSKVLGDSGGRAIAVLRETSDLDEAEKALDDPDDQLASLISKTIAGLLALTPGAGQPLSDDIRAGLTSIRKLVDNLLSKAADPSEQS